MNFKQLWPFAALAALALIPVAAVQAAGVSVGSRATDPRLEIASRSAR